MRQRNYGQSFAVSVKIVKEFAGLMKKRSRTTERCWNAAAKTALSQL